MPPFLGGKMTYHELSECTLTTDERRAEADRILTIITNSLATRQFSFTEIEARFIGTMSHGEYVSVKQLFWLRDIKDKYL
jgi:hypothetical protein